MNLLKIHHQPSSTFHILRTTPHHHHSLTPHFLSLPISPSSHEPKSLLQPKSLSALNSPSQLPISIPNSRPFRVSRTQYSVSRDEDEEERKSSAMDELEDLGQGSAVYQKTLRLVECAMLAAVGGIVYVLSNSLSIENYFGCFFALPIVMTSMRWGVAAGRKTMVATTVLLLILSGPVKALTYLLTHGLLGFTMGSLWRSGTSWHVSVFLGTIARSVGAIGYVLISSFLLRENILALITINIHASLAFTLTACGINSIPSMNMIYTIFGTLVLLNCGSFVFLLHILYSMFLSRLGMKASLKMPRWLEKAL